MSLDLTTLPASAVCICGGTVFKILATFSADEHELETYSCDMYCADPDCGAYLNTPLPIDFD